MNKILGKLILVMALLAPSIGHSAVDIIVSTDRNPVHLDESFQLKFEANGSVDDDPDFSPLRILLDIVRQGESSNISLINGSMSRSKTWTLTVMPKAVGDIQIPAIHFGDDKSPPLLIRVKKADQAKMGDSSFFVNLSSDVKSSIEQAQIIVTIRVFSDKSLNEISLSTLQFNHGDVVVETLGEEKSYQTKVQGKPYLVIEQKVALFPQKAGPLVIQPVLALASVRSNTRTFFGDPASKPVRARSDVLKLDVVERPKTASTWLPAKSVVLTDTWLSDPSQFTVGEPITRVLTLSANGLTAAQLPELEIKELDSLKLYPDQATLQNDLTDLGVTGTRQEKIAYIPSKPGVITLPAKVIKWWNTETKQWDKTEIAKQIITVKKSTSLVEQAPVVTQPEKIEQEIKKEPKQKSLLEPKEASANSDETMWKWIALFCALGWLLMIVLYLNKKQTKKTEDKPPIVKAATFNMTRLKSACQNRDAKACKQAMIEWASARYPNKKITQLAELNTFVSEPLFKQVKQLEAILYGSALIDLWNSDALLAAVLDENKKQKQLDKEESQSLKSFHLS